MSETKKKGNWGKLFSEIWRRFIEPFSHTTFVLYFGLIIFVAGGLGFLIPLVKLAFVEHTKQNLLAVPQNMITYAFAIAATAFIDLVMFRNTYRPIWLIGLMFTGLAFSTSIIAYFPDRIRWVTLLSLVGMCSALFLWWITNCDNNDLKDDFPDPNAMTGGNTKNIEGTTKNIQLD